MLGGVYTLRWRAHVNMELFYARFSPLKKAAIDLVTWMLFYSFCGVLLWKSTVMAWNSISCLEHSITVWGPPVWPVKLTLAIAAFLMIMEGITKTIEDCHIVFSRKLPPTGEIVSVPLERQVLE